MARHKGLQKYVFQNRCYDVPTQSRRKTGLFFCPYNPFMTTKPLQASINARIMYDSALAPTPSQQSLSAPRIAIQGYAGAFHEIASRHYCAPETPEVVPADTFAQLVALVEAGEQCDFGLMAIENTLAGSLIGNYKLLKKSRLLIAGEVFLRIKQNLLALPGVRLEDLREVHSHPIAIAQCVEFFASYPHIKLIDATDTALSARLIQEKGLRDTAAIASELAAELYGLDILAHGIETNKRNFTRFLVLRRPEDMPTLDVPNKVSLSFTVDHQVGSLHKVLAALAAYGANLTKIQSVPIVGRDWEYEFFLDFTVEEGTPYEPALDALAPITHELKLLGAYHVGKHYD